MEHPAWRARAASVAAFALGLSLTLFGCPAKPAYPECKADADCKEHQQVCANGVCRDCFDNTQCKPGQLCVNGGCFVKPECSDSEPCGTGLSCKAGKCVPECTDATSAQDCGEGKRCQANRCVAADACEGDGECGMGKACVEGHCKEQGTITGAALGATLGCELPPITFAYDDAGLDAKGRAALSQAWNCLSGKPFRHLILGGHTDERGTTEYNLALGARRAEAVRKYLAGLGAEAKRVRTVSFGKERPADPGHSEGAWARNRRVELSVEQ